MPRTSRVIATAKIPSLRAARRVRFWPENCRYERIIVGWPPSLSPESSVTFPDPVAANFVPGFDNQPVPGLVQPRDDSLLDVDQEPVSGAAGLDLCRSARKLRLSRPAGGVELRRIVRRA